MSHFNIYQGNSLTVEHHRVNRRVRARVSSTNTGIAVRAPPQTNHSTSNRSIRVAHQRKTAGMDFWARFRGPLPTLVPRPPSGWVPLLTPRRMRNMATPSPALRIASGALRRLANITMSSPMSMAVPISGPYLEHWRMPANPSGSWTVSCNPS